LSVCQQGGRVQGQIPTHCPECGAQAVREQDSAALRCSAGLSCHAQLIERLKHFCARDGMDIDGMGARICEQLVQRKLLNDLSELFTFDQQQWLQLPGVATKKAERLLASTAAAKQRPLPRFLFALGIPHIGKVTADALARHFSSLEAIMQADIEQLLEVPDVGPEVANSLITFFAEAHNQHSLAQFKACGVWPVALQTSSNKTSFFFQKTVVVTGTLQQLTRQQVQQTLRDAGAKVTSSVSKRTDILLAGEGAGSKLKKAQELGISIISESELIEKLALESRHES